MEPIIIMTAIYLRVSTEEQARSGFSLPEQRTACLAKAQDLARQEEQRRGQLVQLQTVEYIDTVSGELLERPGLDQVRQFVREHRPAYFVCLDPDRFSRATHYAILVANEIEAAGTKLEFVQHEYQATPEGKLFFTLRVAIAEYEKTKIKERSIRGKQGKLKQGGLPTGLNMYGYSYNKLTQEVTPHPEEARWVQQMFLWASQGAGCQIIAHRLTAAGVPRKRGDSTAWYRTHVSKILRNSAYMGLWHLNRLDTTGIGVQKQLPKERRSRTLTPTQRPQEDWITVQIPPIITEELWELTRQVRRTDPQRLAQRRKGLLSGLMRCGYCGGPVYYRPRSTTKEYLMVCANRYAYHRELKHPLPECKKLTQSAVKPVEDYVWGKITEWLTKPEALQVYIEQRQAQLPQAKSVTEDLRAELALLEQRLTAQLQAQANILAVVAMGNVAPQVANAQLQPLGEQITSLQSQIADLKRRLGQLTTSQEQGRKTVDRLTEIREAIGRETETVKRKLASLPADKRQELVRMLIRQITVYNRGVYDIEPLT